MVSNLSTASVEPYPGLASFADQPADRALFFGRQKESQALLDLIISENLVLLFARSGLGKTSLINAAVLKPLRDKDFFPVVVRITHDFEHGPLASTYECIRREAARLGLVIDGSPQEGNLWEYFYSVRFLRDGKILKPVLVLDQFEELFTIIDRGKSERESFVKEIADLVRCRVPDHIQDREAKKLDTLAADDPERKRIGALLYEGAGPEVKILISIREDFLAEMETLKPQLPTIFRNSFRLDPLEIEEARKAIVKPTEKADLLGENCFTFGPGVVDELLDFLRLQKVAGTLIKGDYVDPVQLQILCKHLYEQSVKKRGRQTSRSQSSTEGRGQSVPQITLSDLKGRNGMKRALVGYYQKVLKAFPRFRFGWNTRRYKPSLSNLLVINRARRAIRHLAETKLVTPGGYRNSVSVDVIEKRIGVPKQDLSTLVDQRLLRTEPRLGSHFYELTHDTLLKPLSKARRKRRAYWLSIILIPLALVVYLPGLAVVNSYLEERSYRRRISNRNTPVDQRIADFKYILTTARLRDCSRCDLTTGSEGPDLRSFRAYGVDLTEARLSHADLRDSWFVYSDLSKASLEDVNFSGATLLSSDFTNANLSKAKLENANLRNADFSEANLTGSNLAGTQLEGADFTNATVPASAFQKKDDKENILLLEAVWWNAIWPSAKLLELKSSIPNREIEKGMTFKKELRTAEAIAEGFEPVRDVNTVPAEERQEWIEHFKQAATAHNNLAWFRALRGVELDKAEADARKAREYDPKLDRAMDTLGYILLQLKKYDEALPLFEESLLARQQAKTDPVRLGLAYYHLGLLFDHKGDRMKSQSNFDLAKQLGYRPTFECLLTPPSDMTGCDWPNPRKQSPDRGWFSWLWN